MRSQSRCRGGRWLAGVSVALVLAWGGPTCGQTSGAESVGVQPSPDELVAAGAVRVRTRLVPDTPVLVGQKVTLHVEVLTSSWFPQPVGFPDSLQAENAIVLGSTSGGSFVDRIDGATFAGISRRYEMFPVAPGTFLTPEVGVTAIVALDDGSRSPEIELLARSSSVEVGVPPGVAPGGLVVASPSLEVGERWAPGLEEVSVGDSVERRVTMTVGDSVAMLLPSPDLTAPEGVAAYPDDPTFEDRSERGRRGGTRVDSVTYVFEREGTVSWPEVEISWWDTDVGELRTEVLPSRTIKVSPDPGRREDPFADPSQDVVPGQSAVPESGDRGRLLALGGVLVVLLALAALLLRRRRALLGETRGASGTRPEAKRDRRARAAFSAFERSARSDDAQASYRELMGWLAVVGPVAGVDTLAQLCDGEPALAAEVESLEKRLYRSPAGESDGWRGGPLLEEVDAVSRRISATPAAVEATGDLPQRLNPAGPTRRTRVSDNRERESR